MTELKLIPDKFIEFSLIDYHQFLFLLIKLKL
jgi:hypothetical protein